MQQLLYLVQMYEGKHKLNILYDGTKTISNAQSNTNKNHYLEEHKTHVTHKVSVLLKVDGILPMN